MELGRDFSAAAAAPDEKDFLIPPWTPVTPAKPLPIKLQPTSGHILRRTNWHEPTVAADTSTETSYQARFLPHQNALQKEPPCNDREAHFIDSMAITVDQMRNFRNWDASVAARNQISGHGPATDEPSMGITIDQMRNLRNWDATVAARNQISGDSPAAQEPPMGITMDQMRNLQNWDASVGARNQISGHSPAAQEPSMGITIDQMRNLRNWDAPVAARNQISGDSPAAQEPSMGITMDQMRNLQNWDASVAAWNQISGHSPATQEPSMGITIDQMRNLRNWDAPVAARNQISGNSPAAQEPSMGITMDQMRNLRNWDASVVARNQISGTQEPSMGITIDQMRNLRNWDASVASRNQISGNSPAAQEPSMGITVDQMRNLRNCDASAPVRNPISGHSPAVHEPSMGITMNQMRNLRNWDASVVGRNQISGNSPAAQEPSMGITVDQMRNWDASVVARNQISGNSPAVQDPLMGITVDQMRNLKNWDTFVAARNPISGHSPAANEPALRNPTLGLNKLPPHRDVLAFTDASSATANSSLPQTNDAIHQSNTTSSPHLQIHGARQQSNSPYLWLMNQNFLTHGPNQWMNNGCPPSQIPQLPPQSDGFPVPYYATYGVNSSPRKTIANVVTNGNISFQLAPITPDRAMRASQQSNQPTETVNSSADERVDQEEKQNDTTVATPPRKEPNELYCHQGLSSTLYSSPLMENHKPDNCQENGIDLNKTPQQKPKRKKIRPKVVIEGKPKRTPKPVTPRQSSTKENPSGKRKYVRKNGPKASAKPSTENGESTDLSPGAAGVKSCRRALNFNLEYQAMNNSSETNSTRQLGQGIPFDLNQSLTPVLEDYILLPANPPHCPQQEKKDLQENMEAAVRKTILETKGTYVNGRDNGHPPMHPYTHSEDRDRVIISTIKPSENHLSSPPSKSQNGPQLIDSNSNLHTLLADNKHMKPGSKREYSHTIENPHLHTANLIGNHFYSIPPCNKMIQYNEINRNNSNCSTHIPEIYKKKRIENGNAVLTCNPSGPMIGPEAASNKKTVDANPSASEAGTTIRNMYGHSIPGELLASELAKIFSSTHAQQGRNIRRQHTPVRMLSFGHIERESIEKSNISIRGPDLSSSFSAVQCNQLPRTPPKQAPPTDQSKQKSVVHQGAQGSIEVLHSDPQPKKKENKYTVQGPVHLVATMSHTNTNQVRLQERDAATYDNRSFLHSRGFRSQQIVTYRDPVDEIAQRLKRLSINGGNTNIKGQAKTALVPYGRDNKMVPYEGPFDPTKKSRPRPKVDLDSETIRVWKLLMGIEGSDGVKGIDKEKEKRWEEERKIFRGRADSFIARMHLLQGDRRFSQWKGSVVDSVVGVFLTQNVSDHSSSSAFMSLASRFPLRSTSNNGASKPEGTSISAKEQDVSTIDLDDTTKWHSKISSQRVCDRSSMILHEAEHTKEREMTNSNESFGSIVEGNTTDYAKGKHLVTCESGLEMCQESPENRTSTPISVAESVSLGEAEDRRALEDVISSQNSAVSSQNSVDSTVHMASQIGSSSESNSEVEDTITGYKPNGFNGSASFMELLQMTGTSALEEFYINENGSISPEENPKCASNQLENTQFEKRKSNFGKLDSLKGSGPSTSPSDYHLHHLQNEFNNMQGKPSSSFNFTTPESQDRELEFVKVLGEESKASLPSTASEITDTEDVYCMSSRIGPRTETSSKGKIKQKPLSNAQIALAEDSYTSTSKNPPCSGPEASHNHLFREWNKNPIGNEDAIVSTELQVEHAVDYQQKMNEADFRSQNSEVAEPRNLVEALAQRRNNRMQQPHPNFPNYSGETSDIAECTNVVDKHKSTERKVGESNSREKISCFETASIKTNSNILKEKKGTGEADKKKPFDWDSLRKQARRNVATRERSNDAMDSVDWEAVRCADVDDIADSIKERGMNNMLGERIKDFLNRIVREHGSIDLEWLRDIPPDKAKDYLLSIRGLGLKSVECVRLLTLHQLAFPVDTNVGRICVRLGWVPIQPLPESLHIHLLELYPLLETIQKYLWPRLCTLDQRTLYELHYQMITFGKVFCTKSKPNCNACPMRGECKHFASAFASARLALPGPEEKGLVNSTIPTAAGQEHRVVINPMPLPPPEGNLLSQAGSGINKCEPIIEEPATPEPECIENSESDIEDTFYEDPDEIPTIRLNLEELTQNIQNFMQENNMELQDGDMSKALVAITPGAASIPVPKLKNVSRLRTEHLVYELPDSHPLLQGLDQRERDDPCPYLLAIWTPGETVQSTKPPEICCNSQDSGNLCNLKTCFACSSKREENAQKVRGTLLIPCRTAMRGSFPLNGTYFQVNEVFADHASSINPIDVPRAWIWNLPRRTVYFGTSIPTIFRGLTTEGIQYCFWRGFVCVRGFDRTSRAPRPLTARLHFPASMLAKTKKKRAEEAKGK